MNRSASAHSVLVVALLLAMAGTGFGQDGAIDKKPIFKLLNQGRQLRFEVSGLDAKLLDAIASAKLDADQWRKFLSVHVAAQAADVDKNPAMLGSYRATDGKLIFEPRYPPIPGLPYRIVFEPAQLPGQARTKGERIVSTSFVIPKISKPAAEITHVYPSADKLPENQLKFYLHFSAPMSRGEAYDRVRLLNEKGKPVERPFYEIAEELWDPSGQRFTLLIHPGRIKRGLKPREDLGPVLEEGKRYTLVIDQGWHDAEGNPLKAGFRKSFTAGPDDHTPIDVKTWKLTVPRAGSAEPLVVRFPESLDHALLERVLWVVDNRGQPVDGTVKILEQETVWQFAPRKPWALGRYELIAETTLEDLAGNAIGRHFEVDVFRPITKDVVAETAKIPFQVVAPTPSRK